MSDIVRNKIKIKVNAFRKYLSTRADDFNSYARARNQAKWACRNAAKEYERTIAQQAKINPKAFYSHVNHKLKTKPSIPDLDKPARRVTSSDQEKAEVLNKFFTSVFTNEDVLL